MFYLLSFASVAPAAIPGARGVHTYARSIDLGHRLDVHLSTLDHQILLQPPPDTFMAILNSMASSTSNLPTRQDSKSRSKVRVGPKGKHDRRKVEVPVFGRPMFR
jgi:hypothetical protein